MSNTKNVYRFDREGYYIGISLAQYDGQDLLLPPDCTETKPALKDGYWYKWTGKSWSAVKIPTTCADAIDQGLTCISNGPGLHNLQVKAVIETLVANESENYRTVASSDFVMSIESIPEKTLDELKEKKLDELTAAGHQFDKQLVNENMIINSSLGFKANADLRSQNNLRGLISVGIEPVNFVTADNSVKSLTLEQLNVLLNETIKNGENLYKTKWELRNKILNSSTIEELNSIEFKFSMLDFS